MENPSITDVLDFIGTLSLTAFLFFAWRLEREERIKKDTELIVVLRSYADLAQVIMQGGRAAVQQYLRGNAEDDTKILPRTRPPGQSAPDA